MVMTYTEGFSDFGGLPGGSSQLSWEGRVWCQSGEMFRQDRFPFVLFKPLLCFASDFRFYLIIQ